jgi:hypothetical protein
MEWIEKYPDKLWNWGELSNHSFAIDKQNFIRKQHCKWFQLHIFEELASVVFHPSRIIC